MDFFTNLPASILQPPNFPFWAMDNNESNCIELDLGHSTNVRCKTYSKKTRLLSLSNPLAESFSDRAEKALESMVTPKDLNIRTFAEAAKIWLEYKTFLTPSGRARFVSPRSLTDLRQYVSSLCRVFGSRRMDTIHAGHIREFQMARASGELGPTHDELMPRYAKRLAKRLKLPVGTVLADPAKLVMLYSQMDAKPPKEIGPNKINQEIGTLIRVMKYAHCWTPELEEIYMPLQHEESDIPRALSPWEQQHFLNVAASRPEWAFIYWYALVNVDCPMSTNEFRGLRLGDIDLHNNLIMVRVRSSKNKYRTRSIPMSDTARWAMDMIIQRAKEADSLAPQQYLMPFRRKHTWVPDKPMTVSGIKKPFNAVRQAASLPWFRPYDWRHTSITRYAEAGTPIAVIMSLAGHMSRKMQDHYTHISEQAKKKAVQNMSSISVVQQRRHVSC